MKIKYLNYMRIQEWWGHILPPILMFYYAGLWQAAKPAAVIYTLLMLVFLSILTAIAGYFINDLFDIKDDQAAGKKNYVARFPLLAKASFIPVLIFLIFLVFQINPAQVSRISMTLCLVVLAGNVTLFLLYSAPPVRIKKNAFPAPILDALYSGTLFYVLAYLLSLNIGATKIHEAFSIDNRLWIFLLLIFAWGFLKGLRNYLTHLCDDKKNDEASGIRTLATIYGVEKIQSIANLFFPAELIALWILIFLLTDINFAGMVISVIFGVYWLINFRRAPYQKYVFLNDLHEVWLPMIFLIQLVILHHELYPLLIIHFLLFPYHLYKIYCVLDRIYFYTIFKWVGPLK